MSDIYDIFCPRCHVQVARVFSSEPLPGIYHPECAEAEEEEDRDEYGELSPEASEYYFGK